MSYNSAEINEFSDIWVFCEQREGKLMNTDFELISEGRKLADERGSKLVGILLGGEGIENSAKELGGYGADKVIVCADRNLEVYTTDAYSKVLCDVVMEKKPEVLLIGASNIGRDLGPRVAARLHTGLTADATHLDIDMDRYIQFLKESSTIDLENDEDLRTKVLEVVKETKKLVDLIGADIVVSVGRGISKDPEKGIRLAEELAEALGGGVVGASRAVTDAGWLSSDHQVGQTGKTVHPRIYVALGISGAIQHKAGMQDSEIIIAVDSNETAPIFECADYGIVGDLFEVVPHMIEEIRAAKEAK